MLLQLQRILVSILLVFSFALSADFSMAKNVQLTDQQVKKQIIQESIDSYPGNCPCPYNSAKNGSRCGKRSAWSRDGGYAPVCYEKEITKQMVEQWKKQNKQSTN